MEYYYSNHTNSNISPLDYDHTDIYDKSILKSTTHYTDSYNNSVENDINEYIDGYVKEHSFRSTDMKDVKVIHSYSERYDATTDVVIVEFSDGSKEKSVRRFDEEYPFSLELGIGLCIAKHICGGESKFYHVIRDGVKIYEESVADKARKKDQKQKNREENILQQKKKEDKKTAQREHALEDISDVLLLAFKKYEKSKSTTDKAEGEGQIWKKTNTNTDTIQ